MIFPSLEGRPIIPNVRRLIDVCRRRGVPVVCYRQLLG